MTATAEMTRPVNNGSAPIETRNPETPSTELVPAPPAPVHAHALIPRSVDDAIRYAQAFARSGMFAAKTMETALTILLTGMELGLGPAQSMRAIHVIEGKPSLSADAMMALCLAQPHTCRYFTLVSSTDEAAVFETWRVGSPKPVTIPYTVEDAKKANLLGKKNWRENQAQMLIARAKSKTARAVYPDLTMGLYTPEELTSGDVVDADLSLPGPAGAAEEAQCLALEEAIQEICRAAKAGGDATIQGSILAAWTSHLKKSEARRLSEMNLPALTSLHAALAAIVAPAQAEPVEARFKPPVEAPPVNEFPSARAARNDGAAEDLELSGEDDPFADN